VGEDRQLPERGEDDEDERQDSNKLDRRLAAGGEGSWGAEGALGRRAAKGSFGGEAEGHRAQPPPHGATELDANVEKDARGARGTQYSEYVFHTR
jgi:hypothetical protein